MWTTYEYECCVQILVMLLHEFLIILLGLLAVTLVELGTEIFLQQFPTLSFSVRYMSGGGLRGARVNLPIRYARVWFPISTPPRYSSMVLAAIGDQRTVLPGLS